MLFAAAHVVPIIAASFLVRWRDLLRSWLFILLAVWAAKLPAVGIAYFSTDFSTLIGGMIAVVLVGVLSHFHVGLGRDPGRKFDLPPLTPVASASFHDESVSPEAGSTHIQPLKRRLPPMQPARLTDPDAMLAPSGVGAFGHGRPGRAAVEQTGSSGPAAVSAAPPDEEDDIFETAEGLDASSSSSATSGNGGTGYRPHDVGPWKVYTSDKEWAARSGRAVGEGSVCGVGAPRREPCLQGVCICMDAGPWGAACDGYPRTLQHTGHPRRGGESQGTLSGGRRARRHRPSEAVAEGWRRNSENGGAARRSRHHRCLQHAAVCRGSLRSQCARVAPASYPVPPFVNRRSTANLPPQTRSCVASQHAWSEARALCAGVGLPTEPRRGACVCVGQCTNSGGAHAGPYPKHDLPQLRSLESMDSDLESRKHRRSYTGGDGDLADLDPVRDRLAQGYGRHTTPYETTAATVAVVAPHSLLCMHMLAMLQAVQLATHGRPVQRGSGWRPEVAGTAVLGARAGVVDEAPGASVPCTCPGGPLGRAALPLFSHRSSMSHHRWVTRPRRCQRRHVGHRHGCTGSYVLVFVLPTGPRACILLIGTGVQRGIQRSCSSCFAPPRPWRPIPGPRPPAPVCTFICTCRLHLSSVPTVSTCGRDLASVRLHASVKVSG